LLLEYQEHFIHTIGTVISVRIRYRSRSLNNKTEVETHLGTVIPSLMMMYESKTCKTHFPLLLVKSWAQGLNCGAAISPWLHYFKLDQHKIFPNVTISFLKSFSVKWKYEQVTLIINHTTGLTPFSRPTTLSC